MNTLVPRACTLLEQPQLPRRTQGSEPEEFTVVQSPPPTLPSSHTVLPAWPTTAPPVAQMGKHGRQGGGMGRKSPFHCGLQVQGGRCQGGHCCLKEMSHVTNSRRLPLDTRGSQSSPGAKEGCTPRHPQEVCGCRHVVGACIQNRGSYLISFLSFFHSCKTSCDSASLWTCRIQAYCWECADCT